MAAVYVKAAYIWDEYEDTDDPWTLYAAEEWSELERFITQKIEEILLKEDPQLMTRSAGSHYRILPFMIRNGYQDGSGWWIKA